MVAARLVIKKFNYENLKCEAQIKSNLSAIMLYALNNGWRCVGCYGASYHVIFERGKQKMNVYLTTLTIQTALKHPKSGRTQLNRKGLSLMEIEQVFKNPRTHTGKGYHVKK